MIDKSWNFNKYLFRFNIEQVTKLKMSKMTKQPEWNLRFTAVDITE